MNGDLPSYEEASEGGEYKKLFSVGGRGSRNNSATSLVGDEAEAALELLPSDKGREQSTLPQKSESSEPRRCCKISGSCVCKLSVVVYLAMCILISALYVAFYGKNQAIFGDAWIPGKVLVALVG